MTSPDRWMHPGCGRAATPMGYLPQGSHVVGCVEPWGSTRLLRRAGAGWAGRQAVAGLGRHHEAELLQQRQVAPGVTAAHPGDRGDLLGREHLAGPDRVEDA